MSGPHRHLHLHGDNPAARRAPEAKLAGLFLFVLLVALTPTRWMIPIGAEAVIVGLTVAAASLPWRVVLRRLVTITPFIAFAFLLPFVVSGPRMAVGPLHLSQTGLWNAFGIVSKAIIGASATIVVASTTSVPDVVTGLRKLHLPAVIVTIMSFMWRYLDLIAADSGRMRQAMSARGYQPRWLWQARPLANATGALFVRSYERGERIHQAMLARGFDGVMPEPSRTRPVTGTDWAISLLPAVGAAVALIIGAWYGS
ncbi:MAG: cobalt ECF transporter T component CbiQ [Actinobacteria bacterium]|nr:cobalt ECF transporter T component CbiQ [Actinomycetota bacterium]MCB9388836.1 cobalt ECF transporter T component CbiQ [Acidimicrobiia bacterium]